MRGGGGRSLSVEVGGGGWPSVRVSASWRGG